MQKIDLLEEDTKKIFFKYLIPSISATLVTSIYVLADTIMIGKGVGQSGLAVLNFILPLFTVFFGTGLLLGVGGAVRMSVAKGNKDMKLANTYFTNSVIGGAIIALLFMVLGLVFLEPIGYLLGCTENNIGLFISYAKYLVGFCPVFIYSSLLQAFVRNDSAPKRAMVAVISGGVTNIVLDYIFIFLFGMGMAGGAIATVIGSVVSVIILFTHFRDKNNTMKFVRGSLHVKVISQVIQSGLPSFLIELTAGIIVLLFNLQLLKYAGEVGVVAYSIVANCAIVAMSLFNGVSQGAQPIMAMNYGAGRNARVVSVRKLGALTVWVIGVILFLLGSLFPEVLVGIFINPTPEVVEMAKIAIRLYFMAFIIMSLNIFYSTYFQSILKSQISLIICLLRGIVLSSVLLFVLPTFMGVTGIWLVMPITEVMTVIVAIVCVKSPKHKLQ